MHTTYVRHLFHLRWPQIAATFFICFLAAQSVQAQGTGYVRRHLEFYDDKPIHYGFLFALPVTRFNLRHSDTFLESDSAYSIQSPAQGAFRMGFTVNAFLTDHFDLRSTPSVSLYERQVKYRYPGGTERIERRESTWVEIPLLLKYKSVRRINTRMYLLAGVTLAIETNVKRSRGNVSANNRLDTKTSDFTLDYGVGFEQFFQYFKFAPELRFSHGLTNLLQPANNSVSVGLDRLTTHTVTLYLNFE
ncbi:type IX secretion/gliding motility protein PorT/SprT [Arundinibacter roseus]|uniref:PorT family protein n=1 Tax=Arundinibacter roseus TaxID=2070510 RepID=A0A4R4KLB5_9BACT|nr:porin family protein [Arundinibacter roseus]TDB69140.1 PorT family protein [Arundinibacter roseus]